MWGEKKAAVMTFLVLNTEMKTAAISKIDTNINIVSLQLSTNIILKGFFFQKKNINHIRNQRIFSLLSIQFLLIMVSAEVLPNL